MSNWDPGKYQYTNSLSVDYASRKRAEDKKEKIISRMYAVLRKYGKALDEITKGEVTKAEYKQLLEFLELRGYTVSIMYPNLL